VPEIDLASDPAVKSIPGFGFGYPQRVGGLVPGVDGTESQQVSDHAPPTGGDFLRDPDSVGKLDD
jgi:hypothetical protein